MLFVMKIGIARISIRFYNGQMFEFLFLIKAQVSPLRFRFRQTLTADSENAARRRAIHYAMENGYHIVTIKTIQTTPVSPLL